MFITFEGGEGAGKSTQIALLADYLRAQGYPVTTTREPGATQLGQHLRTLLLETTTPLSPRAEALLFAADSAQHVANVIKPALSQGHIVLCDRFLHSMLAYQGFANGNPITDLAHIIQFATQGLLPTHTFLLDVDVHTGMKRAKRRGELNRVEGRGLRFHQLVRAGYLIMAHEEPHWTVIDATRGIEEIQGQIREVVDELLERCQAGPEGSLRIGQVH